MSRIAVIRFPGSNCEMESLRAVERAGGTATLLDYRETSLGDADAVILPGGFSYGDYLRSGAIARFAPIMQAVQEHAAQGGGVIGICNGFQILCEAHLLPGALLRNTRGYSSRPVDVRVERADTICTVDYARGEVIRIPIAHGEGRFAADPQVLDRLEGEGQIMLRYVAVPGGDAAYNPNGSVNDIAGICNAAGNVVGFMPHPERLAEPLVGSEAGQRFFSSMIHFLGAGVSA